MRIKMTLHIEEGKNNVPLHGNFELRPLGATMGNASSVTRA